MKEFNMICKEFEQMPVEEYDLILAAKSAKIIPALSAITEDGLTGIGIFATFIASSIAADGRISEEEYLLCYPLLHAFFGDEIDYDIVKKAMKSYRPEGKELKKCVDEMVDILGLLSDELKDDIIIVCLMICAYRRQGIFERKELDKSAYKIIVQSIIISTQ
ncbi:MAG: hypothetical protein ACI4QR_07030 [Eubacteriales bacterium]